MRALARPHTFAGLVAVVALAACSNPTGDAPLDAGAPTPLGPDARIAQIANPNLPGHPASGAMVSVSGASYLWTDTFDETGNGKSRGTVFLQDVGSSAPYSGVSLFSPTYQPADLKVAPGDVLDLRGTYQENSSIGTAHFPAPQVLPQISKPQVKFRYEYIVPTPTVIDAKDLADYDKGRQWLSMLVTITNPTFTQGVTDDGAGRDTTVTADGAIISNELFNLAAWNVDNGKPIDATKSVKSVTGIVTWFFSYHLAPRTPADIVVQ